MLIARTAVAALKRLDSLFAAGLIGFTVASVCPARLCAEASCRSESDKVMLYSVALLAALVAGVLVWRLARRRWQRLLVVAAALYASIAFPPWIWAHARWTVPQERGTCVVSVGATRTQVRSACGQPTYSCEGPKFIDSTDGLLVCGFVGDVYVDRLITYDCRGGVAQVTAFDGGPPEASRPPGCVTWSR